MKKIHFSIVILAFLFFAVMAVKTPAQMVGGYSKTSAKSAEVRSAARFAVDGEAKHSKKKLTLIGINKAESQVVAGLNYKLCLKVHDGRKIRQATVVVYQNLKNKLSLSEWNWDRCDL